MPPADEEQSAGRSPDADEEQSAGRSPDADEGTPTPPDEEAAGPTVDAGGRREVEVPQSLYKIVTVFSTLLAVLFVVLGFSVLDRATTVLSNPPASIFVQLLALLGIPMGTLTAYRSGIALVVALVGLALVAAGAAVYVYGSRFRAPGMGKPKDEADEPSGDG